jgi:catechol 1,2-dioxygenase
MQDQNLKNVTETAVNLLSKSPNPRLNEIMAKLIQHLHTFASEVKLTEDEWMKGLEFLAAVGKIGLSEFIMLSDAIGLSKVVNIMNHPPLEGITESNFTGPYYRDEAPLLTSPFKIYSGCEEEGEQVLFSGQVMAPEGKPIAGALIELWQTAPNGLYDCVDDTQPDYNFRGQLYTDEQGRYQFQTLKPANYRFPSAGPVGQMLVALDRHTWHAAHIHFKVSADGYEHLVTQLFFKGDPYIKSDVVFAVRESLIINLQKHDSPEEAAQHNVKNPFHTAHYDFVLKPKC